MTEAVVIAVRVTPRGGRDAIDGVGDGGELRVRVAAPPADGSANRSLVKLVAKHLGLPRGAVRVIAGATSRHKRLAIEGMAAEDVVARWPALRVREG